MVAQRPLGSPALYSDENSTKVTRINFVIGCANITQRINLSCVRLTTQVIDMMNLVSDACSQKTNIDDVDAPRPLFRGARPSGSSHKLSPGSGKCWRIMYNVLNLYSSLPREAKAKGKKSALSSTLPGKDSSAHLLVIMHWQLFWTSDCLCHILKT